MEAASIPESPPGARRGNPVFQAVSANILWIMLGVALAIFFVQDPQDSRGALVEAWNLRGPALVNIVISQGSSRKAQEFAWHS